MVGKSLGRSVGRSAGCAVGAAGDAACLLLLPPGRLIGRRAGGPPGARPPGARSARRGASCSRGERGRRAASAWTDLILRRRPTRARMDERMAGRIAQPGRRAQHQQLQGPGEAAQATWRHVTPPLEARSRYLSWI